MTKKKEKKVVLEYCGENYEGDYIAMAHDSISPEYEENAS